MGGQKKLDMLFNNLLNNTTHGDNLKPIYSVFLPFKYNIFAITVLHTYKKT